MDLKTKLFYLGYKDGLKNMPVAINPEVSELPLTILSLLLKYEDGFEDERFYEFEITGELKHYPFRLEVSDYDFYNAFL